MLAIFRRLAYEALRQAILEAGREAAADALQQLAGEMRDGPAPQAPPAVQHKPGQPPVLLPAPPVHVPTAPPPNGQPRRGPGRPRKNPEGRQ